MIDATKLPNYFGIDQHGYVCELCDEVKEERQMHQDGICRGCSGDEDAAEAAKA